MGIAVWIHLQSDIQQEEEFMSVLWTPTVFLWFSTRQTGMPTGLKRISIRARWSKPPISNVPFALWSPSFILCLSICTYGGWTIQHFDMSWVWETCKVVSLASYNEPFFYQLSMHHSIVSDISKHSEVVTLMAFPLSVWCIEMIWVLFLHFWQWGHTSMDSQHWTFELNPPTPSLFLFLPASVLPCCFSISLFFMNRNLNTPIKSEQ